MTEDEKKEFEEFLEWRKGKQEREKQKLQQTKEQIETLEDSNEEQESNNALNQDTPVNQPHNKKKETAILLCFCFLIAVWLISQIGSFNKSKTNTDYQYTTENKYETTDPLQVIRDTVQQASADSIRKANRIEQLKHSVRITTARLSSPNSAGGVDAIVYYKNVSDKTIKYFFWEGYAKNAVGDIVESEIGGRDFFRGKDTGPIKPRKIGGGCWDCIIYNSTAKKLVITEVAIEYMDGTELKITENEMKYIR